MERVVVQAQEWIALYGLKAIAAIAIFVVGRFAANLIRTVIKKVLRKSQVDKRWCPFRPVFPIWA